MKAILNQEIIDLDKLPLDMSNRGFRYGDGLFESVALIRGKPRLLEYHLNRLRQGAELLRINVRNLPDIGNIGKQIQLVQQENRIIENGILRIMLWREDHGMYTPQGNDASILLTIKGTEFDKIKLIPKAGFSKDVNNFPTPTSHLKTMSALKYVIAGLEKEEKKFDEIIILDHKGFVSEALSSNIFWKQGSSYFTPPLSTGCVDGIMRNWLISRLKEDGNQVVEKLARREELLAGNSIFTTNAAGIGHIQSIENHNFEVDKVSQNLIESIS